MASNNCYSLVLVVVALVSAPLAAVAGDPDILTDFIVPMSMIGMPPMNITGDFFTYTGFRTAMNMTMPMPPPALQNFTVTKATVMEFPAMNGRSVSYAMLKFPSESVNPPHTHPRAAELLLVLNGTLCVGFIDTTGKLYTQDLAEGDMFVFPKGLVHYSPTRGKAPPSRSQLSGVPPRGPCPCPSPCSAPASTMRF
ncbi:hypothetical protein ACQ4PT_034203 [Festuca glaucescens]